jgi:UDP-N-acetylmuramate dehydrogenase
MQQLYNTLKQYGKVRLNEPLAKHTTFKIGGPASFFVTVDDTENLVSLLKFLDGEGTSYTILGGGSNTLAQDDVYDGVVIKLKNSEFRIQNDVAIADAGCATVTVAQKTMSAGLTGFEWGVGVPGTIGGAVRGNAGAMGGDMAKDVLKVDVYRDGEVIEIQNAECKFGYRTSIFKQETGVVLRVYLQLETAPPDSGLMQKALEHLQYRNSTQPQGFASSGCIFANADLVGKEQGTRNKEQLLTHFDSDDERVKKFLEVGKISAGWLVEQAGLKGRQVGNAKVSDKHGNFLVNLGGATASDVRALIEEVKGVVYTKFDIDLEEEVSIL